MMMLPDGYIKRVSSTIPFGYELSDINGYLKPVPEQLKNLPTLPGVYKFKNKDKKIIYIGKAKNLKNRIRSYFQNSKAQSSKTISMMKNADSFEWIIVKNEVEALLTEANLIKKHRPKYNILMKDDKTYPYIQINLQLSL